jgi:hypothetical protein
MKVALRAIKRRYKHEVIVIGLQLLGRFMSPFLKMKTVLDYGETALSGIRQN